MNLERFSSPRILNLILICTLALTLATSFFYQFFFNFSPCFLCTLQRICFLVLLVSLITRLAKNSKSLFLDMTSFVFILLGIFLSSRQVSLQDKFLSDDSSFSCSPNLYLNFESTSLTDFFFKLYSLEASCSDVSSTLFGISFAAWSLSIFSLSLATILLIIFKERRSS